MPTVHFTNQLARFVDAPTVSVEGATLGEILDCVFWDNPQLRGYILDDQGAVRQHVAVFVDGVQLKDRSNLSGGVTAEAEIHIFQALSGG
ncbi:MAG: MoaD/ThiS family protein [Rhodospirillales bacterium]|nr:MoaD/ThiS family protein [Rhodospirillales bacterium]MBO6787524.1 MoaD/ThiS family protein [Rhodospirillales bacterium]